MDSSGALPGAGIDGFYHFEGGLRTLQKWGLVQVFGVEVLDEG